MIDKPLSNNKPGRPLTPETILAAALNVSPRTVKRWASNPDTIQSCDENADKLAEAAHSYDPEKTMEILLEDVRHYRRIVDEWLVGRRID